MTTSRARADDERREESSEGGSPLGHGSRAQNDFPDPEGVAEDALKLVVSLLPL
jgi:hypothetical protein